MELAGGHKPETFYLDEGCQFTSTASVGFLKLEEFKISWFGRRRGYDNILVERHWRTFKYVAAGFSAESSRGEPTCLQLWVGSLDMLATVQLEVMACKPLCSLGGRTTHEFYTVLIDLPLVWS